MKEEKGSIFILATISIVLFIIILTITLVSISNTNIKESHIITDAISDSETTQIKNENT